MVLLVVALLAVCTVGQLGGGNVIGLGLALSYGLQLTALFQRCVQVAIDVATYMTSTERVLEYLSCPQEQSTLPPSPHSKAVAFDALSSSDQAQWPRTGSMSFEDVSMRYRDNPLVLKGASFAVRPGERVGICGRTGSGKSSLLQTLFRIVELSSGCITIDGVDISSVPLQILRSRVALIAQDPLLFTGTMRFQLDPFNTHTDDEIHQALGQVGLLDFVMSLPLKLCEPILEGGENLSHGQRQLISIARALLRRCRVLVLDEATSSVDFETDALLQRMLRGSAVQEGVTVLCIAHRLSTILDYDRILVLGQGEVLEYDTPQSLSSREGVFKDMLRDGKL